MITVFLFYLFSGVMLAAASLVVLSRNSVHGVLFLILTFMNAAALFVLAHAEFIAMLLIIVYVGAVAVLFLFVVMMLNVELTHLKESLHRYTFIGGVVGAILTIELILLMIDWVSSEEAPHIISAPVSDLSNAEALGNLLYTHYVLIFQGAGLILLIAMIGALVLTLRHREGIKRQNISEQQSQQPKDTIRLVNLPRGEKSS